jgi:hypothetical protein
MSSAITASIVAVGSAVIASDSARKAANKQGAAAENATALQEKMYNQQREDFQPYAEFGKTGLLPLTGFDAEREMAGWNYEESPAYQAKLAAGQEGLANQLGARGLLRGAVGANRQAGLQRDLYSQDYDKERQFRLGQIKDRYNTLLDRIKVGQGAASSLGQAANQYATGAGNTMMQAGNAQAAGQMANANFWSGLPGAVGQGVSTGLKGYDYGQKAGWWGGGGGGGVSTPTTTSMTGFEAGSMGMGLD